MRRYAVGVLLWSLFLWGCGDDTSTNQSGDLGPDMIIQPDWTDTDAGDDTVEPDIDVVDEDVTTDPIEETDLEDLPDLPPPPRNQSFSVTGGGGAMTSSGHMLYVYVGGPSPMGSSASDIHSIQLGPGAVNNQ